MTSFGDDKASEKPEEVEFESDETERSLTPPDDLAISPDLLDELFETEDPRVQSGVSNDDSDDDLDFIRMSGLTSPKVSADIDAIDEIPDTDQKLSPPVSFYEPGVADVDAAMTPESKAEKEPETAEPPTVKNETPEDVAATVENDIGVDDSSPDVVDSAFDPSELELLLAESPAVDLDEPVRESSDVESAEVSPVVEGTTTDETDFSEIAVSESLDTEPAIDSSDQLPDETNDGSMKPTEAPSATTEIIDLDGFDDDVFPDLLSPVAENTESPAEVTDGAAPDARSVPIFPDELDAAENSMAEDQCTDNQTLPETPAALVDDAQLNDVVFDENLVDTKPENPPVSSVVADSGYIPKRESLPKTEMAATEPINGRRSSRHHRRHQSSLPRVLKAAAVFLVFAGALAYGGYEGYRWFQIQVTNPTTLYYEAEAEAAKGDHLQASRLYEEFVRRNVEHPLSADAMFAAGYQMKQVETEDDQLAHQYNEEALALLGEFARRYPDHPRAGRAQSLMGIVHYSQGDYRAAVDAFIDRGAILRDPAATLPMLRTLARSYAELGEYEAAHSAYIRAANSPGNPAPDMDYDELGEMYRALAQSADSTDDHSAYQALALEHWSHAVRYPGINPTRKNAIRLKVDLLGELGAIEGTPTTLNTGAKTTDIVVPLEGPTAVQPASFELSTPLPFGPIIKGVPGNDNPESAERQELPDIGETTVEPVSVPSVSDDAPTESLSESIVETSGTAFHEIAPGEQLYRIAADHGISSEDLMRWNQIEDANHIEVGQRLILHGPVIEVE